MTDELRVTVVATGLGGREKLEGPMPTATSKTQEATRSDGSIDYEMLEKPTILRHQPPEKHVGDFEAKDVDYLDIPVLAQFNMSENFAIFGGLIAAFNIKNDIGDNDCNC